jgi:hypothetical protein
MNQVDKTDKNYDRLWKIRSLTDTLNDTSAKFYNPSEHLAAKWLCCSKGELLSNDTFLRNITALVQRFTNFAT